MTMAEAKDATEAAVLKAYLDSQDPGGTTTYWLGLKYSVANVHTWSSGPAVSWTNWDNGSPNR